MEVATLLRQATHADQHIQITNAGPIPAAPTLWNPVWDQVLRASVRLVADVLLNLAFALPILGVALSSASQGDDSSLIALLFKTVKEGHNRLVNPSRIVQTALGQLGADGPP